MKKRIIINISNNISEEEALIKVLDVVCGGRVSENAKGIKHFCWLTDYGNLKVSTKPKRKASTTDSFEVF